ncbi:MAG: ABC transporter permease subunit [Pseudomonadota bacterium]
MTDTLAIPDPDPVPTPRARRQTRRAVLIADKIADWVITVGGLLVIVAVFGILVFLAQVVVPLFTDGKVVAQLQRQIGPASEGPALVASTDRYHTVAVQLAPDGKLGVYHLKSGKAIAAPGFDFGGKKVTAANSTITWDDVAFGFEDGTVRFGRLAPVYEILTADKLPAGLIRLDERDRTDGKAVYSAIPGSQFRKASIAATLEDEQKISETGKAIVAIDYHVGGTAERPTRTFATVDADNIVRLSNLESRLNLMTRQMRTTARSSVMPVLPAGVKVAWALTTDQGDQVYVADDGGTVYRFDTRDMNAPKLAETLDLVPGDAKLVAFGFLLGEQSLVIGDTRGTVDVYFRLRVPAARSTDGFTLVKTHALEPHAGAVVAFSPSQRGKMFLTADANGEVWLRHSTSEQSVLKLKKVGSSGAYRALLLSPREDGILATDASGKMTFWEIAVPHPETTLGSIFGKVWYEGYDSPTYTWQSSAGTDSFEPKLSLVPLIFGTIKATFYALLFAVPIALLAAINTSEFVRPTVRATVKPVMEMMASLPSVVLGFIAALILAPIVETWIAAVLMAFVGVPLCLLLAAYLWQLLPQGLVLRLQGIPKFALMFMTLGLGFYLSYSAASQFERLFFAGDIKAWANGDIGNAAGFLFLILLPLCFILVMLGARAALGDWLSATTRRRSGIRAGVFDLLRWLAFFVVACLVSYVLAVVIDALGGDPRGGVVSTYVQRNTLVVGFAMAFAVIPIIYTIAEDALSSVPEHLRAASLACGATPWQTAVRVVLPTAVSGVFAAVMVGMGRAVGETMIVVMAAGNTPILEWNVFNGLRALSANIAVELPEAVKDGTLYRTLFLAALTLFVMTFIVNTLAEIVRQRFRMRAVQL